MSALPQPLSRAGRFALLAAIVLGLGLLSAPAAQPALAATSTITTCDETTLDSAISSAAGGDTISFGCSGDIKLAQTLTISKNLTLNASGQSVTLDGGGSVRVLDVQGGVSLTLNALTIAGGAVYDYGGGLLNRLGGTVMISNSTFVDNAAYVAKSSGDGGTGGGLQNDGTVAITDSTFAHNLSEDDGGGLANFFPGTVTISNSTFADNLSGCCGGALFNSGTMTVSSSTIVDNAAGLGFGGGFYGSGVTFGESIVADNSGGNCTGPDIADAGYNLSSDSRCGFTASTDQQNTDPRLDPSGLQSNGGPTQTIALQSISPAIDVIPACLTSCVPGSDFCPATDQRGAPRPDGGENACDMGAYEFSSPDWTRLLLNTISLIRIFHPPLGLEKSLVAHIGAALRAVNRGDTAGACGALGGFVGEVEAQSGKRLTERQAAEFLDAVQPVVTGLGCERSP